jgi:hypothetical protein
MKAYEQGLSIPILTLEIGMCSNNSAGRPLLQEEVHSLLLTAVHEQCE